MLTTLHFVQAQVVVSIGTDLSVMRNFDGAHKFNNIGQSIISNIHTDEKNGLYAYLTYYKKGRYKNTIFADAIQPATTPASFQFRSQGEMRVNMLSLGYKKFIKGSYDNMDDYNLYYTVGFGLLSASIKNTFLAAVDTSLYSVRNNFRNGEGKTRRLTFDLGGGVEFPVGYEVYLYTDARIMIPTSSKESNYLFKNEGAPFPVSLNIGLRVLFSTKDK